MAMRFFQIERARDALGRVFYQRCFYLFVALLVLITSAPLLVATDLNRIGFNGLQLLVLVAAVAAMGRGLLPFVAASLLALPALVFQVMGIVQDDPHDLMRCWAFTAGFDLLVLGYLLRYVFRDDVMTADKLYGAAAAYLLLAVFWTYLYALAQFHVPRAFALGGTVTQLDPRTGFGDITPLVPVARSLVMLEQLTGVLFIAILIARLAGVYPARK